MTDAAEGILDTEGEGFVFDMASQAEDSGYPVLPKGVYDASIDNVEYMISNNSGNPMWKVTHLITEPEHADKNIVVYNYVTFTAKTMGRAKTFLNKLGHGALCTAAFNPKQVADDGILVGTEHKARLGIRKSDEYGDSNEVKAVLPAGSGGGGAAGSGGFAMG